MNWRNLRNRLMGSPKKQADDVDDELAFHREMRERQLLRDGMNPHEASAAARRAMGNPVAQREDARDAWRFRWLDDLGRDFRYGARTLASQPGFVLAAVLALTLGIGLNTVFFNVYNALALAPWAVRDARHTVQILATPAGPNADRSRTRGYPWPEYRYLAAHSRTLEGIAADDNTGLQIAFGGQAWNSVGIAASENFFDVLGTGFVLGRGFAPSPGEGNAPNAEVVLHYDAWKSRFASDPRIVGKYIQLNGHSLQIVGVAAEGFDGPTPNRPQLWIPAAWRDILHPGTSTWNDANSCCAHLTARMKPDVTRQRVTAELDTLSAQFESQFHTDPHHTMVTSPSFLADPSRMRKMLPAFIPLLVASGLILFLACANVANLQLARAGVRRRELAVRLSLGAARGRLVRQLLAECLLLSLIAGAISIAISQYAPAAIMRAAIPAEESITFTFTNDWRVLAFILAATFVTTTLFGLGPSLRTVRDIAQSGLRDGAGASARSRTRAILLVVQITLCAMLVSGAALLTRALSRAQTIDPGFRSTGIIRIRSAFETSGFDNEKAVAFLPPLLSRISALPGVTAVAHTSITPLGNRFNLTGIQDDRGASIRAGWFEVSASWFDTMSIERRRGQPFSTSDEGRTGIAAINEALAQRLWPQQDPIGKTLNISDAPRTVVAVMKDHAMQRLGGEPELAIYVPSKGTNGSDILVRFEGPSDPLLRDLPRIIRDADSRLLPTIELYAETVGRARGSARLAASIANGLGLLALVLACVGVYGVASFDVAHRTREIGIRLALGSSARAVVATVLRRNLVAVGTGILIGIVGSWGLGSVLHSLLYGVRPSDPSALAATIGILFLVAAIATWSPARRASRVQPSMSLRHE